MLTLAIGDFFIPERAINIPLKFQKLLNPNPNSSPTNNKISRVICLGNITSSNETLKFLYELSGKFHMVKGEFDDASVLKQQLLALSFVETPVPLYQTITVDNFRIGFTNGYQVVPKNDPLALLTLSRELDVDILIWGGTHRVEAYTLDGKFFINPGSGTGAYTYDWPYNDDDEESKEGDGSEKSSSEKDNDSVKEEDEKDEEVKEEEDKASSSPKEDQKTQKQTESEEGSDSDLNEDDLREVSELSACIPSFCLLDTHGSTCTLYIYTCINDEVKVDKVTYQKE